MKNSILLLLTILLIAFNSCKKDDKNEPIMPEGQSDTVTVTDIDGNIYNTVTIGTQIWMAENLKATHYSDGTEIPLVADSTAWGNLSDDNTSDAYCYYNNANNESENYGALYTWAAAMGDNAVSSNTNPSGVQGVCPTGWHLPSDAEWTDLTGYIATNGHPGSEGTALKAKSGWDSDGNGTDDYGFFALPSSGRDYEGTFYGVDDNCRWWSSTEDYGSNSWYRYINYNYANVFRLSSKKSSGFSVRCIKD